MLQLNGKSKELPLKEYQLLRIKKMCHQIYNKRFTVVFLIYYLFGGSKSTWVSKKNSDFSVLLQSFNRNKQSRTVGHVIN